MRFLANPYYDPGFAQPDRRRRPGRGRFEADLAFPGFWRQLVLFGRFLRSLSTREELSDFGDRLYGDGTAWSLWRVSWPTGCVERPAGDPAAPMTRQRADPGRSSVSQTLRGRWPSAKLRDRISRANEMTDWYRIGDSWAATPNSWLPWSMWWANRTGVATPICIGAMIRHGKRRRKRKSSAPSFKVDQGGVVRGAH